MRRVVHLGEMLEIQMRIDLRRRDARMTEHLLHGTQVTAGLKQVRGKRVTQHVRMHLEAAAFGPANQSLFDAARRQSRAAQADE